MAVINLHIEHNLHSKKYLHNLLYFGLIAIKEDEKCSNCQVARKSEELAKFSKGHLFLSWSRGQRAELLRSEEVALVLPLKLDCSLRIYSTW